MPAIPAIRRTAEPPVLPEDLARKLLTAVTPLAPTPVRREAMLARILARAREVQAPRLNTIFQMTASGSPWEDLGGGVTRRVLADTPSTFAWLFRLLPGASIPAHAHDADESCVVLDGDLWLDDLHLQAGDFHFAPKGTLHSVIRSDAGCTLYLSTAP